MKKTIHRARPGLVPALLVLGLARSPSFAEETKEADPSMNIAREFQVDTLTQDRAAFKEGYNQFLKVPTLRCGLYELKAGAEDGQSPHKEDEVYHVLKGRAKLRVMEGGKARDMEARPGSILFVAAHADHRFIEIQEDMLVLVFFSSAPVPPVPDGAAPPSPTGEGQ